MSKNYICVFDCETIPDVEALSRVYGFSGDDLDVSLQALNQQKEQTGSEFLPVVFHKVVAISAVLADEYGKFIKVSTLEGENECEILTKFINFINKSSPRLVSFNGKGFDLPLIMLRAMKYNLVANGYFETENRILNKNKWENYRSRYDGRFHLDLLDHITDFGSVRGLKLDYLCSCLGLPGKYDLCGDQVLMLYYQNELDKINEYCESDTLNTYWLFLKYELLRGNLTLDDYANSLNLMENYLKTNKNFASYTPVFCDFVSKEFARLRGEEIEKKIDIGELENKLNLKKASQINKPLKSSKIQEEEVLPEINLDIE